MGLGVHDNGFWAGTLHQVWRFDNYLEPGARYKGHDALYVPSVAYTTGDVDVHDIHIQGETPLFCGDAVQLHCLAQGGQKLSGVVASTLHRSVCN